MSRNGSNVKVILRGPLWTCFVGWI